MEPPKPVRELCDAFAAGLDTKLGDKLAGVYLYGALSFPETERIGDVDFHVVLAGPLTEGERGRLLAMHEDLKRRFPPLGAELDGYYILLDDARRREPPQSEMWCRAVDHAWALHRAHIHAGRFIALRGPDPRDIYPPADWAELAGALDHELTFVEEHLHEHPDYCFCQLCRIAYSFRTQDVVVSKAAAAAWGIEAFPAWRRRIETARSAYARLSPGQRQFLLAGVDAFYAEAHRSIARSRAAAAEPPERSDPRGDSTGRPAP